LKGTEQKVRRSAKDLSSVLQFEKGFLVFRVDSPDEPAIFMVDQSHEWLPPGEQAGTKLSSATADKLPGRKARANRYSSELGIGKSLSPIRALIGPALPEIHGINPHGAITEKVKLLSPPK
jgi:hypothetical protein